MGKRRRSLEDVLSTTCAACNEGFDTMQGLSAHQTMSKRCAWYKKGKLREIFDFDDFDSSSDDERLEVVGRTPINSSVSSDEDPEDQSDIGSTFDFIEVSAPRQQGASSVAGPSSRASRRNALALDDNEDRRVEDIDMNAATVIRTNEDIRRSWLDQREREREREAQPPDKDQEQTEDEAETANPWAPFQSEMDWRFASWAVQEGLSQSSVDRVLEIPGFQERLGLSYHNSRVLLQRVDSLPERAEWKERWLSFKDRPDERHLVQFRDIIEAIRTLLGNPAHADQIVYRPRRIFSDSSRTSRIYHEMWTGRWWHAVQVSFLFTVL
ncbi:uncharacterized protein B0H18DRAFT_892900 [Fomitopsis serialis]|uniref:uncharacterized protein n=1 Tax=Fomitopsis serialis TaxID=139415 RepID=UPI0020083D76|nr:uncharacterized protein B0H18DRAFT_892900 [Neoantrodia serialis]KAH9911408.1 hypothetical protein B0H18DRAFT_892900 [Neoantrodia serialis]